jgi:hypothetical protein
LRLKDEGIGLLVAGHKSPGWGMGDRTSASAAPVAERVATRGRRRETPVKVAATLAVEMAVMPAVAIEGATVSPPLTTTVAAAAMQVAGVVAMATTTRTRERDAGEVVRTGITALPSSRR